MPSALSSQLVRTIVTLAATLTVIWLTVLYELQRNKAGELQDAEQSTVFQAQVFAENSLSIIKRLDELLQDLRADWQERPAAFADIVRRRQGYMADIAFQVAVIDADGYLAYSNLAAPTNRTYLGEREHFRVHKEGSGDRLFISDPLKGKVSGKWSIQFTRPILQAGRFLGVLVISVSPDTFAAFRSRLNLAPGSVVTMTRNDGSIMARAPGDESALGQRLAGTPYQVPNPPLAGHFTRASQTDGIERVYGFYRLPEYGLAFNVGQRVEDILEPYRDYRGTVTATALAISALVAGFLLLLHRTLSARARTEDSLRDLQAMLRSAVDAIGEGFVIYDQEDRLAYCNDRYREYYHQSADLLVPGRRFEDIIRIGAERGQYKEAEGRIEAWVAERMAVHRRGDTDLIQQLEDRWLRIRERRTPEGFTVGFRIDITELVKAREAAEGASRAKSQFLATMSHEIRTPMNGILGMAQLMLLPNLEESERQEAARIILHSGKTLLTLLNDILDLSKVEAGKLELELAPVAPGAIVREMAALFSEPAQAKGLRIETEWQGVSDRRYQGDATRLRQMLSNLVTNAVKFTARGFVRIAARETAGQDGRPMLEFSVADSGIGIPPEKQSQLFSPFTQADSSTTREYGGTGLGLSIVRSLVQIMGGSVGLESEPGKGTRIWFRIPALAAEPDGAHDVAGAAPPASVAAIGRPCHVLVVEDNPTNRRVLEALLKKQGISFESVDNGRAALEAVTGGLLADLILMDCQMPVMDGYTATEGIRRWEAENGRPRLPIVALTADAFHEDRERCLAAGMDDFLAKPISLPELTAVVARWSGDAATAG